MKCRLASVDELASCECAAPAPTAAALQAAQSTLAGLPEIDNAAQLVDATFVDLLDVHQVPSSTERCKRHFVQLLPPLRVWQLRHAGACGNCDVATVMILQSHQTHD
jgi:hypothetical protein